LPTAITTAAGPASTQFGDAGVLALPASARAAGTARRLVRDVCGRSPLSSLTEDAELVASELVTNAVRHGSGAIRLRVQIREREVFLAVDDDGDRLPRLPRLRAVESWRTRGRGLTVVTALCARLGVRPYPDGGKSVWAVLAEPGSVYTAVSAEG
jgi:anti-sigma regulatory factor (Ser/Thr protein kinase)